MGRLLDALLDLDNAGRLGVRLLGKQSTAGRQLAEAVAGVRRELAARALADEALHFDPKTDLKRIFAAAEATGLGWPDLAEALNEYHQLTPRRP